VLIYQRQYARHYVIAQIMRNRLIVEIARPNAVSATLESHVMSSLDGGRLCGCEAI
jgi:hypothetical protein